VYGARWIIEAAPKCMAIITGNVGFDGIDVVAATENNILVVNNLHLSGVLKKFQIMPSLCSSPVLRR